MGVPESSCLPGEQTGPLRPCWLPLTQEDAHSFPTSPMCKTGNKEYFTPSHLPCDRKYVLKPDHSVSCHVWSGPILCTPVAAVLEQSGNTGGEQRFSFYNVTFFTGSPTCTSHTLAVAPLFLARVLHPYS